MEPFVHYGTDDTPTIMFNKESEQFEIRGKSLPEDVIAFYTPVITWIDDYAKSPNSKTTLKLKLDYINSASQRAMLEVLTAFERIAKNGGGVSVEWHYNENDDEMLETGEEYGEMVDLPFSYIPYEPL